MGQEQGDATQRVAGNDAQAQKILENSVSIELRDRFMADAMAPAPGLAQRMWDVTKEGVKQIPEGFVNSLDPKNILPNVTIGAGIGATMKAVLPEGGPVAKAASGALGLYFVGKPLLESYYMAATAQTNLDMYKAERHLGDTLGGMPVSMVEGAVGAKLGSAAMGKAMSTTVAAPFVSWKAKQYAALDVKMDGANAALRNAAFEKMGVGGPVMRMPEGHYSGVVPPYVLEQLAKNTKNPAYLETIRKTEALSLNGAHLRGNATSMAIDHKGAREVYDAKGREVMGDLVRTETQAKTGNKEVDNVFDYTGDVRSYYKDVHGRNSIDGQGMKLKSTVNFGKNYENAYWDGEKMTYGHPGPESPFRTFVLRDVTGHEISHGVTEKTAGTVYRNQPGALNEHYSDVFGALVDQRARGQSATEAKWLVGEGIWKDGVKGTGLRDMRKPGTAFDDPQLGKDPQPAHMRDYNRTRSDNGGVHINSGIPNKAFADFAVSVGGNAYDVPGKIWFEARAKAGAEPSFAQFAFETIEAAKRIAPESVPKLQKAWEDVGVKPSKTDTGITEVPVLVGQTPDRKN